MPIYILHMMEKHLQLLLLLSCKCTHHFFKPIRCAIQELDFFPHLMKALFFRITLLSPKSKIESKSKESASLGKGSNTCRTQEKDCRRWKRSQCILSSSINPYWSAIVQPYGMHINCLRVGFAKSPNKPSSKVT